MKNQHVLKITNLKKNDSAEYRFTLQQFNPGRRKANIPGVTVVVTDLRVKITPSAVVTEGQNVTLTCSTSCPLTDDTNYTWYLNRRPLTPPEYQNKHLVIDKVRIQHAGNYSCAATTQRDIRSHEKTLTVSNGGLSLSNTGRWTPAAAAGVGAALLVLILLTVVLWIRRKRSSSQSPGTETSSNMEQLNPGSVYEEISAHPTEQDDLHYSTVHYSKNHTDPLYSTVQPHQTQDQEHVLYAAVNFRQN
uniref:low affinity immunoglobulin gamma Fc region receptor II-like n=1 Tax=Semicossyphus pulcher TaxID=241346 RepID=UPI0037E8431B